jgi:hypothetical protein
VLYALSLGCGCTTRRASAALVPVLTVVIVYQFWAHLPRCIYITLPQHTLQLSDQAWVDKLVVTALLRLSLTQNS